MTRKIAVGNSERGGRGVFATEAIRRGETIEVCPLLVGPKDDWGRVTENYVFNVDPGKDALALGYGSLYNHSTQPNAAYERASKYTLAFRATRPIAEGEEICVSYGSAWWKHRGLEPN